MSGSGETGASAASRAPSRHEWLLVVTLLSIFAGLALDSMARDNPTFDETAHLAAGLAYVQTGDFRMNAEHPALPKLLAGLAASASGVRVATDNEAWAASEQWDFARAVLYESGVSARRIVFFGRLPSVALAGLLGLLLWRWTRAMAGPTAAAIALTLYAFCPNILAHGHLVTTDVPLTLFVVATAACLWQARRTGGTRWIVAASGCIALSMVTKFSAFSYAPAWAALALWPSERRAPRRGAFHGALLAAASFAFTELLVFACYGGATDWTAFRTLGLEGRGVTPETMSALRRVPYEVLSRVPWPSADFARGLKDILLYTEAGHPVYLLGKTADRGWWWAPFVTLFFKMSLPLILFTAIGIAHLVRHRLDRTADLAFLAIPALLVLATNVAANLGIGVRHLLPMFPFLMAFAAWPMRAGLPASRPMRLGMIAILAWQVAGAVAIRPHHLAFFNELARAAGGGERLLGDSNLDWGQDLSAAAARLEERGVTQAILGYFGTASPFAEKIQWQLLPPTQRRRSKDPWIVMSTEGDQWLVLSTTNRQGIYYRAPNGGPPYPFLDGVPPVETVGNGSIGIWETSKNTEVQRGLADLYLRHGLAEEAEAALRRTLARLPYDAESRRKLVRILRGRGELARADSTILAGPNPDVPMLLEWISIRQELGDVEKTRAAFETSLEGFPEDPELKNAYAWWLQETGLDLDRALELADEAVRWGPEDPYFRDTRAMVYRKRGERARALEEVEAARALPGGDLPAIHWHRVLILADAGRMEQALDAARALTAREDLSEKLRVEIEQWLYEVGR